MAPLKPCGCIHFFIWFSPISTNTIDNRIATMTGGIIQGLTKDPGDQDHLSQLDINNIFEELDRPMYRGKFTIP